MRCLLALVIVLGAAGLSLAEAADAPLTRIVVGSCLRQDRPAPVWRQIAAQDPELIILCGDNVYTDTKQLIDEHGRDSTTRHEAAYQQLLSDPTFRGLKDRGLIIATWDDHDYGLNDAGGEYPKKNEAQKLFLDFWDGPQDSPRRNQAGIYAAYTYGPEGQRVQVLLLDTRYDRSAPTRVGHIYIPSSDRRQQVLSAEQWRWLKQALNEPADLRLLVTSIQFLPDEHRFEKWANFPLERAKLGQLLGQSRANGVVIISGDRHHAEISKAPESPTGYPLYEFTVSGLNQKRPPSNEKNRFRISPLYAKPHFGTVTIDWDRRQVAFSILAAETSQLIAAETITLDQLRPPSPQAND